MNKLDSKLIGLLVLTASALMACGEGALPAPEGSTPGAEHASERSSGDPREESRGEGPRVRGRFELEAHPLSETLDASVHATVTEEGARIDVMGTFQIGEEPVSHRLEFDLGAKTYKAIKKELPDVAFKTDSRGMANMGSSPPTTVPGTSYGRVSIAYVHLASLDIPQLALATTWTYVAWDTTPGSTKQPVGTKVCLPHNGTGTYWPFNTQWYVASCTESFGSPWAMQVNGSYYNWDWRRDDQKTTAEHMLRIQPHGNGTFTYWTSVAHAGEDSWALQVNLYVNGLKKY